MRELAQTEPKHKLSLSLGKMRLEKSGKQGVVLLPVNLNLPHFVMSILSSAAGNCGAVLASTRGRCRAAVLVRTPWMRLYTSR